MAAGSPSLDRASSGVARAALCWCMLDCSSSTAFEESRSSRATRSERAAASSASSRASPASGAGRSPSLAAEAGLALAEPLSDLWMAFDDLSKHKACTI